MQNKWQKWLTIFPPLTYLIIFFAIPTLIMVFASFRTNGTFGGLAPLFDPITGALNITFEHYPRFFEDFIYIKIFIKSFIYAGLTTLICLIMGYPLAMLIARSDKKYRNILLLLVILPFWSNFLIKIYAWMIILGPESAFSKAFNALLHLFGYEENVSLLFSPFAVLIGLVYVHIAFMILPLYANLEKHDPNLILASKDLGANDWQTFWQVTFPLSLPGVYAGSALVFIPALGIFAVPDLIGGTNGIMIGNVIKQQFLEARDWSFGSVLSIILTIFALALVWAVSKMASQNVEQIDDSKIIEE